jgi:hypothetical protein
MEFRQLRYVCAIADTGNPQPRPRALSDRPALALTAGLELEEDLGEAAGRGSMGWRLPASKLPFSPNRLAFGFFSPRSAFVNECADGYQIRPRHLYHQTDRDKVSEWNCGI